MAVSTMLLERLGSGIDAELEYEEKKPPKPRNGRKRRCTESLNGKNRKRVGRGVGGGNPAPGTTRVLK